MRPREKVPVIPSRAAIIAALIVATVGTGFIPSTGHAAQTVLGCPGTVQAGDQFTIAVTVDVAATCTAAVDCGMGWTCASGKCTTALGAYGITLTYDPNLVTIASVAGGDTSEFSSPPTSNTAVPGTPLCFARRTWLLPVQGAGAGTGRAVSCRSAVSAGPKMP